MLLEQKISTSTALYNRQENDQAADPLLSSGGNRIMETRSVVESVVQDFPDLLTRDVALSRDTRERTYGAMEKKINIPLNLVGLLLSRKSPLKVLHTHFDCVLLPFVLDLDTKSNSRSNIYNNFQDSDWRKVRGI
jgi:hypothetical protein